MGVKLPFAVSIEGKNLVFSLLLGLLSFKNKATAHTVQLHSQFTRCECEFGVCCLVLAGGVL